MNIEELYTKELHEKGSEMQVIDKFGKKLSMFITLQGTDSAAFRKAKIKMSRAVLKDPTGDNEERRAEALAEISTGWRGFKDGKKNLKFTKKLIKGLYVNAPYIMDQADSYINRQVNFTKG